MKKKLLLILLMILVIGLVSAVVIPNIIIIVKEGNAEILLRKGIGEINKTREICNNESICHNETYIDILQLQEQGCSNGYCYFKLFEDGGIDKPFKIMLEQICSKMGICKELEMEESYECCIEWREETNEEIIIKANKKSEEILNHIAGVTLEREARGRVKKVDDINVNIDEK